MNVVKQLPETEEQILYLKEKETRNAENNQLLDEIFTATSFSALNDKAQRMVIDYIKVIYPTTNLRLDFDDLALFRHRYSLSETVKQADYRLAEITEIELPNVPLLSDGQKTALAQELYFYFFILSAQLQLDVLEQRIQNQAKLRSQVNQCAKLLNSLRYSLDPKDLDLPQQYAIDDSEKPVKYLGSMIIAPIIIEAIEQMQTSKLADIINYFNDIRLYWVWGGSFLDEVFAQLGSGAVPARQRLSIPAPVTGYMSFVLYFARGAIALGLLLKHTIAGPWMSQAESDIPLWERFSTQWRQRCFLILNDWIWGFANMACFLWLIGSKTYLGDRLTALLLIMDLSLSAMSLWKEHTDYLAASKRYSRDMELVNKKLQQCAVDISALEEEIKTNPNHRPELTDRLASIKEKQEQLQHHAHQLIRAKTRCDQDWNDKCTRLCYDLIYALSLIVAFCLMCSLFPTTSTLAANLMVINLLGAASCFVLSVVYTTMVSRIEVNRTRLNHQQLIETEEDYIKKFNTLYDELERSDQLDQSRERLELGLRQCYLSILSLRAKSNFQRERINFQQLQLLQSTLISAFVPVFVYASLMFLPFASSIGLLAAGFALILVWTKLFEGYAPVPSTWEEYEVNIENKSMQDHCVYVSLASEEPIKIHCTVKRAGGAPEDFVLTKTELGKHSAKMVSLLKDNQGEFTSEQKKQILMSIKQQGFEFNQPVFNPTEYAQFATETRQEYVNQQQKTPKSAESR